MCLEQLLAYVKGSAPPLEPLSKSIDGVNIKPAATGVKSENKTTSEKPKQEQGVGIFWTS